MALSDSVFNCHFATNCYFALKPLFGGILPESHRGGEILKRPRFGRRRPGPRVRRRLRPASRYRYMWEMREVLEILRIGHADDVDRV